MAVGCDPVNAAWRCGPRGSQASHDETRQSRRGYLENPAIGLLVVSEHNNFNRLPPAFPDKVVAGVSPKINLVDTPSDGS